MTRILACTLLAMSLLSFTGCLLNHSTHQVVRQAEPLQHVTFQSEDARNAFEAYVESAVDDDSNRSHNAIAVPFLMALSRSKSISESAVRNDAAVRFDVNGDRVISDYEVSLHR